jgi:hypothetical protein
MSKPTIDEVLKRIEKLEKAVFSAPLPRVKTKKESFGGCHRRNTVLN